MAHMVNAMNQTSAALTGSGGNQRIGQRQAFGCGTRQIESGESQPFIDCHHVIDEQPISLGSLASFSILSPLVPASVWQTRSASNSPAKYLPPHHRKFLALVANPLRGGGASNAEVSNK